MRKRTDGDHLKLIDFGFSKVWQRNTKMDLSCGTLSYVAPEVLRQSYTSQCDLWSLGVIAFILLLGYMPFAGDEDRQKDHIKAGKYTKKPEKWAAISPNAFIEQLLVVDSSVRLTAEQDALEHRFITERKHNASQGVDPDVASELW
ncbi:unnamed protein product [Prorocentrum cordatum]|uniref:Protein kinase domain-containing protein n=1 Tax=Prorocentrum cordatum TaxID=2364126 RepID=A0ABN9WZP5_9DINO|nr:unnamed protein product [Polarella glacialis]